MSGIRLLGLATAVLMAVYSIRRFYRQSVKNPHKLPLPPGPRTLPFVGSLLEVDKQAPFLTLTTWAKKYGDIVYTQAFAYEFVILNSEQVAIELLDKRSQKYSDRPPDPTSDVFGFEWPTSNARYGPRFRLHRRLLHQFFNAQASLAQRPRQMQKAYELVTTLLNDPSHYASHFTTYSAAVVMEMTYGCDSKMGEFAISMQRASETATRTCTLPVIAMFIFFPFVKSLPSWLPGMGFQTQAAQCKRLTNEALNVPYEWVKWQVREGSAAPSMVADAITRYDMDDDAKDSEVIQAIKHSAGTLYAAAVETTNSTLVIFIYLMMSHPEIQQRAQVEIDSIVGRKRLPNIEDRISLPYVDAVMRETIRWHPVLPVSLPHATTEDDVYQGYYIPKGAMVIPNIWAISHDEEKYPNPEAFTPERFLEEDGSLNGDEISWIFGFGRRICPGRHVGEVTLWAAMVCILALFKVEKTEGSDDVKWTTALTSHPLPFPCKLIPRYEGMDGRRLAELMDAARVDL